VSTLHVVLKLAEHVSESLREEVRPTEVKSHRGVFIVLSLALHLTLFLAMGAWLAPPPLIDLDLPEEIEIGMMDGDPGEAGEPPPATTVRCLPMSAATASRRSAWAAAWGSARAASAPASAARPAR